MHRLFAILFVLFISASASSQQLGQVGFLDGAHLSYFSFYTDPGVLIRISEDGKILEWGSEVRADRYEYYAPKLQPFMGRIEYYDQGADSAYKGKVKSIGTYAITYYASYDEAKKRGKIKSIGMLQFDYYSAYDEKALQGKLKFVGSLMLEYYRSYEDEAVRGKLKTIGNMPITYYTVFEDKYNTGKLKSIGTVNYTWYNQFDRARGGLKSNNYRQNIGGILFVLR